MSKGENIFKRKDGRWEARYIKGYELSGKIKYGFCYGKTYKEAKEKVTKFKAAMANGSPLPAVGSRHRFAFYCDEWLRLVFFLDCQRIAPPGIILPQHLDDLLIAYDCHTNTSVQVAFPRSCIFILVKLRRSYASIL